MKIDLYTKGILTVIALSLVVMAFKDVDPISKAFAHDSDCATSRELGNAVIDIQNIIIAEINRSIKLTTR